MAELADEAAQALELSDDVSKDAGRINETLGGMARTVRRVLRTAAPEADRRADPRFGTLYEVAVVAGAERHFGTAVNTSAGGVAVQIDDALPAGALASLEAACLGGARAAHVVGVSPGVVHLAFADPLDGGITARLSSEGAAAVCRRAILDHQGFVENVLAVLNGSARTKASDLANHHTCRLGRWSDTITDTRVLHHPLYAALAEPHRRVHDAGKRALACHWHDDPAGATAAAAELREASQRVVELLGGMAQALV